jgi:hypothetical protein
LKIFVGESGTRLKTRIVHWGPSILAHPSTFRFCQGGIASYPLSQNAQTLSSEVTGGGFMIPYTISSSDRLSAWERGLTFRWRPRGSRGALVGFMLREDDVQSASLVRNTREEAASNSDTTRFAAVDLFSFASECQKCLPNSPAFWLSFLLH